MADDLDVTRVFLSSLTLISAPKAGPERESFDWIGALIKMLVTFDVENKNGIAAMAAKQCEPFARRLAELPLARLAPADEEQARENLNLIIDQERRRLEEILSVLQAIADADQADAPARLAFETGPEGDRYRRYEVTNERLALQSFDRFLRTRNFVVTGRFDQIDVDLQDLIGSTPPQVEAHTGLEPAIVANGDSNFVSGPLSVVRCTKGGVRSDVPAVAEFNGETSAPSRQQDTVCDDTHFLRNEAIEFVRCPLSVVRCKSDALNEPRTSGELTLAGRTASEGGGPTGFNEPGTSDELTLSAVADVADDGQRRADLAAILTSGFPDAGREEWSDVPSSAAIRRKTWGPMPEVPYDARPRHALSPDGPDDKCQTPGLLPLNSFGKIVLRTDQARGRACTERISRAGILP